MRKTLIALAVVGFMGAVSASQAGEGHGDDSKHMSSEKGMGHDGMKHGDDHGMDGHKEKDGHGMDGHGKEGHKMDGMFLKKKQIDGYAVSFHVMKPADGPSMGGTHHVMIKVEKDGKPVDGVVINSKVVYPDGESDSKKTMKMGSWYMAGYDMHDSGKHQLMILFKTPDGKKHKGGVYYP